MPRKTFFNLPIDKQKQIINNAITEFGKGTYNEIKISAIIRAAGIPRSSFYDYFEDKFDLYGYIIEQIVEKKAKYYAEVTSSEDFFEELRSYILSGVKFIAFEPELDTIAKYFLTDKALIKELYGEEMNVHLAFKDMLVKGIDNGSIRSDIDVDFIAKTLNLLASGLMLEGVKSDNKTLEEVLSEMADKMISFIKYGICALS